MNIWSNLLKWSGADAPSESTKSAQDYTNYVEAAVLKTMQHPTYGEVDVIHYFTVGFYEFAVVHDAEERVHVVMTLELRPILHERASLTTYGA